MTEHEIDRMIMAAQETHTMLLKVSAALFASEDALECLRRGHGTEVQSHVYPALNLVRSACAELRAGYATPVQRPT